MGRSSRFGFPIPGRKSNTPRNPIIEERVPIVRIDGPINTSKAEKLLGHSGPVFAHPGTSYLEPVSVDTLPGLAPAYSYDSIHISSDAATITPSRVDGLRPRNASRASSHVLGLEDHRGTSVSASVGTSTTRNVTHKGSSSTIRSFYDSKKSPPAVSQQTSASAVRDMALRKGLQPSYNSKDGQDHTTPNEFRHRENHSPDSKKRPPMLDLSRLFPKPKSHARGQNSLLSPNKFVNSPTQLSAISDYSTRDQKSRAKSVRSQISAGSPRYAPSSSSYARSTDPSDTAKTNVRRPPKGIQHWFDALSSDDDCSDDGAELVEEARRLTAHEPVKPPVRKSSLNQILPNGRMAQMELYSPQGNSHNAEYTDPLSRVSPTIPRHRKRSQSSLYSQSTSSSAITKESKMSHIDLRTTSALSISSSDEDGARDTPAKDQSHVVRQSLVMSEVEGDIIIGKAQAYELHSRAVRHPSTKSKGSRTSAHTLSSSAGTIEMCYTPAPPLPSLGSRFSQRSRAGRSNHAQRHSTIQEDEGRPHTAYAEPPNAQTGSPASDSASIRSFNTSRSEPKVSEHRKLMAVTEEEEALLEMMRQKRAAMASRNFSKGYRTALERGTSSPTRADYAGDESRREEVGPRTSGFLRTETPTAEMINSFPAPLSATLPESTPLLKAQVPPRIRDKQPKPARINTTGTPGKLVPAHTVTRDAVVLGEQRNFTLWRDSGMSDAEHFSSAAYQAPDSLPSPCQTDSIASATSASHPSPLPSPATPGAGHVGSEMKIKVASSEPSCSGDDEEAATPPHLVTDFAHSSTRIASMALSEKGSQRTLTTRSSRVVTPVLELTTDARSNMDPGVPQRMTPRRTSGANPNRNSSRTSIGSASSRRESRSHRNPNRESLSPSIATSLNTRCSVSEDILAAWGSLGGWRDYDMGKQPWH